MPWDTAAYSSHWSPKATAAPMSPSSSPSYTKGQRMNPSVAPTIFMMAISSRRSKVVSLMVLEMMNTEMISRMAIRAMLMTPAMLRTVMKPLEISWSARTLAIPSTLSRLCTTWPIRFRSVRCMT